MSGCDGARTGFRALFLDRDGVVNVDYGYVHRHENFDFIDGIFDLARAAYEMDFKLVIITNQAGIARGYYSEREFQELTAWMCQRFATERAPIAKVYFSPFHPTAGVGKYKKDDFSRKPNPGMIFEAKQELSLDLGQSILIGDKATDVQAGIAAGVGKNILFSSFIPDDLPTNSCYHISSLREALPFLNDDDLSQKDH